MVKLQAVQRSRRGARRPIGNAPAAPPLQRLVQKIKVLLQAVQRSRRGARKPVGAPTVSVQGGTYVKRPLVRSQAVRTARQRRLRGGAVALGTPRGDYTPANFTPHPVKIVSIVCGRVAARRHNRPSAKLGKPHGSLVVTPKPHVRAIQVVRAVIDNLFARRHRKTTADLGKVFGKPTRNPPVRPIKTVDFAASSRMRRVRVHGSVRLSPVVRTFSGIPPPPTTSGPAGKKRHARVQIGSKWYEVIDHDSAQQVYDRAIADVTKEAREKLERVRQTRGAVSKVKVPDVAVARGNADLALAQKLRADSKGLKSKVAEVYRQAAQDIELAAKLRKQLDDDDDEVLFLLG
jgi:hypothetical protein